MTITLDTRISDIAAAAPATIRVFQRHQIEFCCGGKIPLAEACASLGIDSQALVHELIAAQEVPDDLDDWSTATLSSLIGHIQTRFHEPLRSELPRLGAMLDKAVLRHGDRLGETLRPLQATFDRLQRDLLEHMAKEDAVLFPAINAAEATARQHPGSAETWTWIGQPLAVMVDEHEAAGEALARMRALTGGYAAPDDACPTLRGLYHGLGQLERDMHVHVHLENNVLFPRAADLAASAARDAAPPCGCSLNSRDGR